MKIFKYNGAVLPVGTHFELEGLAYPWNWFDLASVDDLKAHGFTVEEVPDPIAVPEEISDRQFFQLLAITSVITQDEALAAVKTGTVPVALDTLVKGLPAEAQFGAEMLLSGAVVFHRNHPLTIAMGAAYGWSSAQIDDFWRKAATL